MPSARTKVSVIVPMFNEAETLGITLGKLLEELKPCGHDFEIVCVDDGSTDRTPLLLQDWCTRDVRVRAVTLSRNFGKESALAAGLMAAEGDAAILIDADMQHPPTLIPQMLKHWSEGYEVVNAEKRDRGQEGFLYRVMAGVFNTLMGAAAGGTQRGASDFKLLDRQVIQALHQCPERQRFFRGLVTWVGFREISVPFEVAPRAAGVTKWSVWGLVRYSLRNLLAFSAFPLKLVAVLGFLGLLVAIVISAITLYHYATGTAVSGFTTVILLQSIIGGVLLASLGVLALYVSEMYDEQKQRPLFIVRHPRLPGEPMASRPERME